MFCHHNFDGCQNFLSWFPALSIDWLTDTRRRPCSHNRGRVWSTTLLLHTQMELKKSRQNKLVFPKIIWLCKSHKLQTQNRQVSLLYCLPISYLDVLRLFLVSSWSRPWEALGKSKKKIVLIDCSVNSSAFFTPGFLQWNNSSPTEDLQQTNCWPKNIRTLCTRLIVYNLKL